MKIIFKFLTISILLMPYATLQAQLGKRLGDAIQKSAENATVRKAEQKTDQAVVDKLAENGVARDRLKAAGKGQNSPIADNSTDEGRAKNRRVEFVKF